MGKRISFRTLKEFLAPFRDAYARSGATVGEMEYGIIYVAALVAALDGEMTDDEVRLVMDFASSCPGSSSEGMRKGRDFALRQAGYLELIARFPDFYTEEVRLGRFHEAVEAGPFDQFESLDRKCLVHAFTFWTAVAMADGDFSRIERQALEELKTRLDHRRAERKQDEIENIKRVAACSIDYDKTIAQLVGKREDPLAGEDFVARAEKLLGDAEGNGQVK